MSPVIKLEKISQYNDLKDFETKHPLISVFDNSTTKAQPDNCVIYFGFYGILLKAGNFGELKYGRNNYGYDYGTLFLFRRETRS